MLRTTFELLFEGQGHSMTFQHNCVRPITSLFEVLFKTISYKWSPCWDDVSRTTFGSLPWRSRSQHDLAAKSCPAYNFVIWSRITKLFYKKWPPCWVDVSRANLGPYLEGQGQSATLQQNCVRPITLLFKVWFYNVFYINDHHIETTCRALHLGRFLKVKVTAWPFNIIVSGQ